MTSSFSPLKDYKQYYSKTRENHKNHYTESKRGTSFSNFIRETKTRERKTSSHLREEEKVPSTRSSIKRSSILVNSDKRESVSKKKVPFNFSEKLKDISAYDGETVLFVCNIANAKKIEWLHDGRKIDSSDNYDIQYKQGVCTLGILELSFPDQGVYVCKAYSSNDEESETKCYLKVDPALDETLITKSDASFSCVEHAPKILVHLQSMRVKENQAVLLSCKISGHPKVEVSWIKDNKEIFESDSITFTKMNDIYQLEISNACVQDCGTYACEAFNSYGESVTCMTLFVESSSSLDNDIDSQSLFTTFPQSCSVDEGDDVIFTAQLTSEAKAFSWFKDGALLRAEDASTKYLIEEGRDNNEYCLKILSATHADSACYNCSIKPMKADSAVVSSAFALSVNLDKDILDTATTN